MLFVMLGSISIHAPREGSDKAKCKNANTTFISIHAPREGSDVSGLAATGVNQVFQSTLPVRGATPGTDQRTGQRQISIHAPREGSDHISHGD